MAQVVLITETDGTSFQTVLQGYLDLGWSMGNLATCVWYEPISNQRYVTYSMVVTDMTYIPLTGSLNVVLVSAAYTVGALDQYIDASTSGSNYAITLPASVGLGRTIIIKKVTSGNTVTITPAGTDTIDGVTTLALSQQNTAYSMIDAAVGKWRIF